MTDGLTPAEVLARLRAYTESLVQPAWRPIVEDRPAKPHESSFCGTPWLPRGTKWPRCPCGRHRQLFAQIDLAAFDGRFGDGWLQVFHHHGRRQFSPAALPHVAQLRQCDLGSHVRVVPKEPAEASGTVWNDRSRFPSRTIVGWERFDDWPSPERCAINYDGYEDDRGDDRFEIECAEAGLKVSLPHGDPEVGRLWQELWDHDGWAPSAIGGAVTRGDKVGGNARFIQCGGRPCCPKCDEPLRLLLQIDSNHSIDFMFGDSGRLFVFQCAGHLDELEHWWECC